MRRRIRTPWCSTERPHLVHLAGIESRRAVEHGDRKSGSRDAERHTLEPHGIKIDSKGIIWVALAPSWHDRENRSPDAGGDPVQRGRRRFEVARLDVLADGTIWFGDEARDARPPQPCDRRPERVARARRSEGRPYALTKDDQDRVWFSEANTKRLVGFDPKTEKFFANIEVSGAIRNMHFDRKTRTMWFGTDANSRGRIKLQDGN